MFWRGGIMSLPMELDFFLRKLDNCLRKLCFCGEITITAKYKRPFVVESVASPFQ